MKKAKQPIAVDAEIARQRELDAIETADAEQLLAQLSHVCVCHAGHAIRIHVEQVAVVKCWLRCHWSAGWRAAGGPSGAPGPEAYAKQPGEVKK